MTVMYRSDGPPGPQGWGIPNEPVKTWIATEARTYDEIGQVAPGYLMRSGPAAAKDPRIMATIQRIQQDNGIDSGFCHMFAAEAIFGERLAWLKQLIGSCVASGDMRTTTYRMLAEVFIFQQPEELPGVDIDGVDAIPFFAPFNYRAGRDEAGISGYSDGSLCVPHIRGKMKRGHLPCYTPGLESDRFPEPVNQSLYRKWGATNSLIDKHAAPARIFPLTTSEKITTADQAKESIVEYLAPLNICSMWGFAPDYTHPTWKLANGDPVVIYKRSGSWAHNMSVVGFVEVQGREFVIIENSWGNYHKNGTWFAIPATLFDTWLRSAECQSVGEIDLTDSADPWPDEPA